MRRILALALATAAVLILQLALFNGGRFMPGGVTVALAIDSKGDFHSGVDDGFDPHTGEKGNGGGGNGR